MNNFLLLLTIILLPQLLKAQADTTQLLPQDSLGQIYTIVEEMPRFPGCKDLEGTVQEKKSCADMNLLKYIYNNWKIPKTAIENQVCERIVVSFVIDQQGKVRNIKILKEPGYGMGASIMQLLEAMNNLPQAWRPGYHKGKPVAVQYNLPIRYHLNY